MLLLAGLGNPGPRHAGNRHNIGFMAADAIHRRHGFGPWRARFEGLVSEGTIEGARALLLKPQTYMNESGRSVGQAMRYLKLSPPEVVVLHDELDLPAGKLRVKAGGGHGGNNGLRSIDAHIGRDYRRVRLGVGHPGAKEKVHGHLLSDFVRADEGWRDALLEAVAVNVGLLVKGDDGGFMNRVHLLTGEAKPAGLEKPGQGGTPARRSELRASTAVPAGPGPSAHPAPASAFADSLRKLFGVKAR